MIDDLLTTGARGGSGAGDQVWGARRDRGGGRQEQQLSDVSGMIMIRLIMRKYMKGQALKLILKIYLFRYSCE